MRMHREEGEGEKKQGKKLGLINTHRHSLHHSPKHACIYIHICIYAWCLGIHPPPRKPETFAKKSHRRSPNKRTNHTSWASSSSVHGPFLIAAGGLLPPPLPLLLRCSPPPPPCSFLLLLPHMLAAAAAGVAINWWWRWSSIGVVDRPPRSSSPTAAAGQASLMVSFSSDPP